MKPTAVRLNPDGSIDHSFTLGGPITGQPAVTPSGKIYVASNVPTSATGFVMPALYRLNSDGSLDTSFGPAGDGKVVVNEAENVNALVTRLVAQGESALLAVSGGLVSTLYRFRSDGSLDPTFGTAGAIVFDSLLNSQAPGRTIQLSILALDPQGRIVLAGPTTDFSISPARITVVRLDASGHGDASFGASDTASVSFSPRTSGLAGLGFTPDGKISLAATVSDLDGRFALGIARLNVDGSPDTAVGVGGTTITPLESGLPADVAHIDPLGRVVLVRMGSDEVKNAQIVIQRVLPVLPILVPVVPIAPAVANITPVVSHKHISGFVVRFRTPMSPTVGQMADYRLVSAGRDGKFGTKDDRTAPLSSAVYDATTNVVRIRVRHPLSRQSTYRLTALATVLTDTAGHHPASDFVADFRGRV